MHQVIPLDKVSREDIRDMAHAAADNGVPLAEANRFEVGGANHRHFEHDYLERSCALAGDD